MHRTGWRKKVMWWTARGGANQWCGEPHVVEEKPEPTDTRGAHRVERAAVARVGVLGYGIIFRTLGME
jgi:hypothetical protein